MSSPKESRTDAAGQVQGHEGGRNDIDEQSAIVRVQVPPHTGLLREEVLVLRDLLGYVDFTDETTTLEPPQVGVPLPNSRMKDLLLVGLDVDTFQGYEQLVPDQQLHIGISLLDTRELQASIQDADFPGGLIDSYQFTVGSSKYCQRASRKFMFGRSEALDICRIRPRLQQLIGGRPFALVLHGSSSDMKMLRNLDVDPATLGCVYVFDTNKVAQWVLQLHYRLGLEKLLERLEIPFDDLHAAGNDAHFSLRALLMLACKDAERLRELHGCVTEDGLLAVIRRIAQGPRPMSRFEKWRVQEQVFADEKREREFNKRRKRLAKRERRRETLEASAQVQALEKTDNLEDRNLVDTIADKTDGYESYSGCVSVLRHDSHCLTCYLLTL